MMEKANIDFNKSDLLQIEGQGITVDQVAAHVETIKRGFPFVKLVRPCTLGDGIHTTTQDDLSKLSTIFSEALTEGRVMKFVPASGAASRMFQTLHQILENDSLANAADIAAEAQREDPDCQYAVTFIENIRSFAFYDDLSEVMAKSGTSLEEALQKGDVKTIIKFVIEESGLDYDALPKGLIKFHQYLDHSRTAFEEHLVEAVAYTLDGGNAAHIHFTVADDLLERIKGFLAEAQKKYTQNSTQFQISYSVQKKSTDTICLDLDNELFRDEAGRLVFRPGGHGALINNLNDLKGDIVFIKNIDNIAQDRLKIKNYVYKKALGGCLVKMQKAIFDYLELLDTGKESEQQLNEMMEFASQTLSIEIPDSVHNGSEQDKKSYLYQKFNRPIRVCGMVKNQGEPGGGPFWVEDSEGECSLQIIESSQINKGADDQKEILMSATHFNPVDIVCGLRDYKGNNFNLQDFIDPNTGFVSLKSKDGCELKALELPGLWNGAMANWISVFIEVPISTFNPVKTVNDLLRPEHQL